MFNSGILDVAIGLTFVFLLVSLLVTIANEMVAAAFLSRATWLKKGITQLLGSTWMKKLYAHPLIQGTTATGIIAKKAVGPSYIPSRAYATVLLNLVAGQDGAVSTARAALQNILDQFPTNTGSVASLKDAIRMAIDDVASKKLQTELQAMLDNMPSAGDAPLKVAGDIESTSKLLSDPAFADVKKILDDLAQNIRQDASAYDSKRLGDGLDIAIKAIPYIGVTAEALKKDLRDLMQRIGGYSLGDAKRDIQIFVNGISDRYMRQMISQIPDSDSHLKQTLTVLLDDAEHNVEKFKENIEVWFNNAMDRVGGWYKRRSQLTTFLLALVLTVALNVDALLILRHLNTQPGVRDSLVAQAKVFAEHPAGRLQTTVLPSGSKSDQSSSSQATLDTEFTSIQTQLNQLSLPIGWFAASERNTFRENNKLMLPQTTVHSWDPSDWTDWPDLMKNLSFHWMGWLITALAASLGAPFWFDMLNKIMSIRSAGKAPEEKPKPPKEVPTPLEPGQSPREADRANALQRA